MPEDFGALRVVDLKEECKKRNLLVGGKKQELIDRLEEFEASKGDADKEQPKDTSEASKKETLLRPGAPEEVEAAAEDIVHADATARQGDIDKVSDSSAQNKAEPGEPVSSPQTSSKGQPAASVPLTSADADEQPDATANASSASDADNAAEITPAASTPARSSKPIRRAVVARKAQKMHVVEELTANSLPQAASEIETEPPAVQAPASTTDADAPVLPATDVAEASPQDATDSAQPVSAESAHKAEAPTAMNVDATLETDVPIIVETKAADTQEPQAVDKPAHKSDHDAKPTAADKAAPQAAAVDAGTTDAAAVKDTEMVHADASDAKSSKAGKSHRHDRDESHESYGVIRKRGRDSDVTAREDRKAPRTERKSDVRASHREKDREREKEKDRGSERKEANGNLSSERRRKHAPISYKPPERQTSQADRDKGGTDTTMQEAGSDKKGSGGHAADPLPKRGSGLEGKQSDLDRSVSRTESGHKLSVFERLQRGKGEGSGAATLPANRESLPSPASSRPSEPLPRTTSHSRRNQPTRALRIEGFVRPFTEAAAQAMLSETGDILSMWMPKIKTHAFVIYATLGQAEATLKATQNLNWPEAVPASKLSPKFVPVEEAETAIARAAGVAPSGATALPAAATAAANGLPLSRDPSAAQDGRAKPEADDVGRGLVLHRGRADANEPRRARDTLDDRRRPREEERRRPKEEIVFRAPEAVPEPQVQEAPPPTLDDLFRKTTTKPCLYWLPLTEDQATERKAKLEAAAAETSKGEDVPEAPVPMMVA